MAVPLPRPLPAPVISTLFMVSSSSVVALIKSIGSRSPQQASSRHFAVLSGHTARHADRSDERSVGRADRDSAGVWNQTAVRTLGRGSGPARLAVFPQTLARTVEEDRGLRFLQRAVD